MTMNYIVDYELCSALFLTMVMVQFFISKRPKNIRNKLFGWFLILSFLTITLDVITAYSIEQAASFPLWLNYILLISLFILQNSLSVMMMVYILSLAKINFKNTFRWFIPAMIPYVLIGIVLISTPFTHAVFYFDAEYNYIKTVLYVCMYAINFIYLIASLTEVIILRKRLAKNECYTLSTFALFCFAASLVQYFNPEYLIIGCAIGLSVSMFYLVLQNPEGKIDGMTRVFNRTSYIEALNDIMYTGKREYVTVFAIDDTKVVNNTYTVPVGNELLKQFSAYISSLSKGEVYRIIGDQFAVITKNEKDGELLANCVHDRMESPWTLGNVTLKATVCICYGAKIDRDMTQSRFMLTIERAILNAKQLGKNTVIRIDEKIFEQTERELNIENALRKAVQEETIEVYYQPIYSVREEDFTICEALARYEHPKLGNISPGVFIPIAERNGLILPLGKQILNKVCDFISNSKLIEDGILTFAEVNLSAVELINEELTDDVMQILDKHGMGEKIQFEITETAATASYERAMFNIMELKKHNINFTMDDFGSGYANIDNIISFPFNSVKIDRSIMLASMRDEKSRIVLENLFVIFHRLGMKTVVEGVETKEQDEMMRKMGADYIQGYYYSYPLPPKQFESFMRNKIKNNSNAVVK